MNVALIDQKDREDISRLEEKFSQKKSNDNAIITLGIERDGEISLFPGDQPVFKNILLKKGVRNIFLRSMVTNRKEKNALCSICKQKKEEVYGFAIPWTFHTFDKPGFIAGGFNIIESWKNTPVCLSCAIRLEVGKKYVEQNLDFGFYGFRYLLVPKLTFAGNKKEVLEEVLDILGKKDEKRKVKINREIRTHNCR